MKEEKQLTNERTITDWVNKITKWTLVSLVFLHPLIFNPFGYDKYILTKLVFLRLATLVLIIVWIAKAGQKNKIQLVRASLNLPILGLALATAISTGFSIHQLTGIYGKFNRYEGLLTILNYFLLYYFVLLHFSSKPEENNRLLIRALLLSASLVSIYGILQHFGFDFFQWSSQTIDPARSFSTLANPIFLGAFLSFAIPFFLIEIFRSESLAESLALSGSLALVGSCLVFTYSRAAWLGTALSIMIVIAYTYQTMWQKRRVLLQVTLAIIAVAAISSLPAKTSPAQTYSFVERASSTFEAKEESADQRFAIWNTCPAIIKTRPLVGSGPDTFGLFFPKYKSVKVARRLRQPGLVDKAHNDLLQTATTLGLLGLLFYLWFIIVFFWKGFVNLKRESTSPLRWLQIGALTATLSYLVQIQFSFSVIIVAPMFWLLVGVVASTWEHKTYTLKPTSPNIAKVIRYSSCLLLATIIIFILLNDTKAVVADTYANYGGKNILNGDYKKATTQLEQAVKLNPKEGIYHLFLGTAYSKIAGGTQAGSPTQAYWLSKAEKSFKDASRLNPLDETPYLTLGEFYLSFGELGNPLLLQKASLYFKKSLKLDPNNYQTHFNLGTVYAQQGIIGKAISEWEETVALNPSFSDAYYNLGQAFEEKGNLRKAEFYYKKTLQLKPSDWEARESLARVRKARGKK